MTYFSIALRNNNTLIVQYNNNKYLNKFYYVNKLLYTLILKKNVINILNYFELFFIVFMYVIIILVMWDDYFRWSEVISEMILEKYKFAHLHKNIKKIFSI